MLVKKHVIPDGHLDDPLHGCQQFQNYEIRFCIEKSALKTCALCIAKTLPPPLCYMSYNSLLSKLSKLYYLPYWNKRVKDKFHKLGSWFWSGPVFWGLDPYPVFITIMIFAIFVFKIFMNHWKQYIGIFLMWLN